MYFRFSSLPVLLVAVLFCSCASVSVKKTEMIGPGTKNRVPEKIFVQPFVFDSEGLRVDRDGEKLALFKQGVQARMSRDLVRRLPKFVAPAEAVLPQAALPRGNYWAITGRFDRIHQGSRFMRMTVGMGAGGTKLNATVIVYDLSGRYWRPILRIETTGGSNFSPGTLGTAGYFVSGVTSLASVVYALDGIQSGVTFDSTRTAREITAAISEYLYMQGAIPHDKAVAPKRLGKFPAIWPFTQRPAKKEGSVLVVPVEGQ